MSQCYDVLSPGIKPGPHPIPEPLVKCPYCGNNARKATGKEIYPHRKKLWKRKFFICQPCDARVGCHDVKGHKWKPFGTMANKELRKLRQRAHAAFDPMWDSEGASFTRYQAYGWLGCMMGLERDDTHIGMFNEEQCLKVVRVCKEWSSRKS